MNHFANAEYVGYCNVYLSSPYYAEEKLNKSDVQTSYSYSKYNTDIHLIHWVQLCGWPARVAFQPPSRISSKSDIIILQQALKDGECVWVLMTAQEVNDLWVELKDKPRKKQERRSDAGGTHKKSGKCKRNENTNPDEGEERLAKQSKGKGKAKGQVPPLMNSLAVENGATSNKCSSDSE
jgi:hypothetical protein